MKISTRTRYGIRAALELAENYNKGPLQLGTIAQRQDISVKYLEQIMAMLKSGNFIRSLRGPRGGYMLAKAPNQIKLSDVFDCLEGTVTTVECVKDKNYCARSVDCIAKQLWQQVHRAIRDVLQSVTLQDLLDKAKDNRGPDYQI
jgi:Rrf2 family protein